MLVGGYAVGVYGHVRATSDIDFFYHSISDNIVRISAEVDHPFRVKPISCFGRSRSPVSVQVDHPFRLKPITCFG